LDIKEDAQLSHDEMVAMVFLLRQSRISSVGRFSSSRSVLVPGADKLLRNPITGIAGCCAAPPRSVNNSRRVIRSPRRRGRAASAFRLWRFQALIDQPGNELDRAQFAHERGIEWAPRKIGPARRTPQNCPRMIPFRSRSDSLTFTPRLSAIGSESDFSRFPNVISFKRPTISRFVVGVAWRPSGLICTSSTSSVVVVLNSGKIDGLPR
jgi:hypothetical protein